MVNCKKPGCKAEPYKDGYCIDHFMKRQPGAPPGSTPGAVPKSKEEKKSSDIDFPPDMPKWERLQIKIFSRWINQKINSHGLRFLSLSSSHSISIRNCVTDISAAVLVALMETLSETKFKKKLKPETSRIIKVDNTAEALKYCWTCGTMSSVAIKASVENLINGEKTPVLGFIWGIMMNFLKFDTDDDSLSAQDALMMWLKNNTRGYKGVNVQNFTTSWRDGMALCALIHKFRPKMINFDKLNPGDGKTNLKTAMAAAEAYFGLDQFLEPEDIPLLEDKSMIIYLSEYYYGVYNMRKTDLSAKRITKLIAMTQTNDNMKKTYNERATEVTRHLNDAIRMLSDRKVDNTMEGAIKKLDDFYKYKKTQKAKLIGDFLNTETLYNHLAMRLSDHHRPVYAPKDLTITDLRNGFAKLEQAEADRNQHLFNEKNRQVRLLQLDEQYKNQVKNLLEWTASKKAILGAECSPSKSDEAEVELQKVQTIRKEIANVKEIRVMKQCGAQVDEMKKEKYEKIADITATQDKLVADFKSLDDFSSEIESCRNDDFKRLQFLEMLRLKQSQHSAIAENLKQWCTEKSGMVQEIATIEDLTVISTVQIQIQRISRMLSEQKDKVEQANVFKGFGKEILSLKYTGKKEASFEEPDTIKKLEEEVDAELDTVAQAGSNCADFLDDTLKKLVDNEKLALLRRTLSAQNNQHKATFDQLIAFFSEKESYLATRESMDDIKNPSTYTWSEELITSTLEAIEAIHGYRVEQKARKGQADALVDFGQKLQSTEHHNKGLNWENDYVCEYKDDIKNRHDQLQPGFDKLTKAAEEREAFLTDRLANLQDNKARTEWLNLLSLRAKEHEKNVNILIDRFNEQKNYLNIVEEIETLPAARLALIALDRCNNEIKNLALMSNQLQEEGKRIQAEKRETKYNSAKYEASEAIDALLKGLNDILAEINDLSSKSKDPRLQKALEREQFKCNLKLRYQHQIAEAVTYCRTQEEMALSAHFGFTLEEVQACENTLKGVDTAISNEKDSFKAKLAALDKEREDLGGLGVDFWGDSAEPYSAACESLNKALKARDESYKKELDHQLKLDAYADIANPFIDKLNTRKDEIGTKGELEKQLAFVNSMLDSKVDRRDLPIIEEKQKAMDAAGITRNRHCLHSYTDIKVQWEQFIDLLERKKAQLTEGIETKLRRGVTDEQLHEIKSQWARFDINKNNFMDKNELKNLFFSLGEDRTKNEITTIMKKYKCDEKGMTYNQFQAFMIDQLGDTDTKDEIINGWKLIHKNGATGNWQTCDILFSDKDMEYLKENAPDEGDGFSYVKWTGSVFER